jgi:hypothetical protein
MGTLAKKALKCHHRHPHLSGTAATGHISEPRTSTPNLKHHGATVSTGHISELGEQSGLDRSPVSVRCHPCIRLKKLARLPPFSKSASTPSHEIWGQIELGEPCQRFLRNQLAAFQDLLRTRAYGAPQQFCRGTTMSWVAKMYQACSQKAEQNSDPWKRVLERALPADVASISTAALLDLLDLPHTTGNARRLAQTMRAMGWVGLKSRRLMPGGFRDTTIRGWARPVRESRHRSTLKPSDEVQSPRLDTPTL